MARVLILGSLAESLTNFRGPLIMEMVKKGHEIIACAPNASEKIRNELSKMGVSYKNIVLNRAGLSPMQDVRSLFDLVKLFIELKPDAFFGYTIKPVIYGSISAKIANIPKIYSLISGLGLAFSSSGIRAKLIGAVAKNLYRLALRFNQKVFFQNPDDLQTFKFKGIIAYKNQAVLVNGSGVDLGWYLPTRFPDNVSFLLISRLIKAKGVYEYVEASRLIRNKYPETKFYLVGYIDERNPTAVSKRDLESWIESGVIEFKGFLEDVRPAIENSSVYVLPSYYPEGTPRSVLEAMAMGRPIVTTDTPGCRETVQKGKNGFLIPTRDVPALVQAMEYFILHPAEIQRMGLASRRIAEEKYDVHKVNAIMLEAMGL